MSKPKFYSVDQTYDGDICRSHGYFNEKANAMTKALKVVANLQDEIISMRNFCDNDKVANSYNEDMHRIEDTNKFAEWRGGYEGVVIYELEIED